MLGDVQWSWLEQKMASEVDHRVIVSSIQFLAMGHGWEAWKTMPHERQRLIDLIDTSSSILYCLFLEIDIEVDYIN